MRSNAVLLVVGLAVLLVDPLMRNGSSAFAQTSPFTTFEPPRPGETRPPLPELEEEAPEPEIILPPIPPPPGMTTRHDPQGPVLQRIDFVMTGVLAVGKLPHEERRVDPIPQVLRILVVQRDPVSLVSNRRVRSLGFRAER